MKYVSVRLGKKKKSRQNYLLIRKLNKVNHKFINYNIKYNNYIYCSKSSTLAYCLTHSFTFAINSSFFILIIVVYVFLNNHDHDLLHDLKLFAAALLLPLNNPLTKS